MNESSARFHNDGELNININFENSNSEEKLLCVNCKKPIKTFQPVKIIVEGEFNFEGLQYSDKPKIEHENCEDRSE